VAEQERPEVAIMGRDQFLETIAAFVACWKPVTAALGLGATAGRRPRGMCPLCGRDVALRRGGELYVHRRPDWPDRFCQGSGHTIADRAREVLDDR
jgi:hypothetical protein